MLLDRATELQHAWSRKILSLSNYVDQFPISTYEELADVLSAALLSNRDDARRDLSSLRVSLNHVAQRLEQCGLPAKAQQLRAAIDSVQNGQT